MHLLLSRGGHALSAPLLLSLWTFALLLVPPPPGPRGREITLYVESAGEGSGDGSAARPFRDPAAAIEALRGRRARERAEGIAPVPVTILFGEGTWELDASLRLDGECSGTAAAPTVLRGRGEGTRLLGGRVLPASGWRPVADPSVRERLEGKEARAHVRVLDLAPDGLREHLGSMVPRGMGRPVTPAPSELFLDGRPLVRARWPNTGLAPVEGIVDPGSIPRQRADDVPPAERETGPIRGGAFRFSPERVRRWASAPGAWMFGYWRWDWADDLLPVERIDPDGGVVRLALPHRYGLHAGARFRVTNLLEELDTPGEYHLDTASGTLYVWPPTGDADGEYALSLLADPLLVLEEARHVVVRDLCLEITRGTGIRIAGGANVSIEDCRLRGTGAHGIEVWGTRHTVRRCALSGLGATGVVLRGGERTTLTPGGNAVLDCEIRDSGRLWRTYQPAVSISGVGNVVAHDHLWDGPHSAIIFSGNDHRIEYNEIHDVLRETGDCGAIYTGRDWTSFGNVIRHNLIHDLPGTDNRWQNGVYLDDMASGITVEGNIFFRCNSGMLVGGGRHVLIRHNIFLDSPLGLRFDARGVGWMAKQLADPSTSTLHRRLRAMPIDRPPWSERFPELRETLTVGFGRPVGSAVVGNVFVKTPFGSVEDRESVRVEGNVVTDEAGGLFARPPTARDRVFAFAGAEYVPPGVEGFPPLPVGAIGPRPR